jgi:hypothetical protein
METGALSTVAPVKPLPSSFHDRVQVPPEGMTRGSPVKEAMRGGRMRRTLRVLVVTRSVPVATIV